MKRLLFLISILFLVCISTFAQQKPDTTGPVENIQVYSRVRNNAIELRWYPANAAAWRKGNKNGYTVKRKTLSADASSEFTALAVIMPLSNEEWKRTSAGDDFSELTRKAIFTPVTAKGFTEIQNAENELFFGYVLGSSLSPLALKNAGVVFTDDKTDPGKEYAYTISINQGKGKKYKEDEVLVIVADTRAPYKAPTVQDVTSEEGEGFVKLTWNNTTSQQSFAAYNIERSADGGKSFIKINKSPYTTAADNPEFIFYTDSVKNYIPYRYRVTGITFWADEGSPSVAIAAMGRDRTAASPPTNTKAKGDRSKITVTWEMPHSSSDLKGFKIARSHLLEGPFHSLNDKLLPVSERSFTDMTPVPDEPFYAVYAVDTANNMSSTFSVMASIYDTVPPSKPTALQGLIDSNGVVKLNWKFGQDNDLLGYQVYMANGRNNIFRQITSSPLIDSVITDTVTMRSLTEEVYYKITAVDYNNNASAYSEILTVKRPDVIPPAAPVIIRYNVTDNKANIIWANSKSTDVVKHALYRTSSETGSAEKLVKEFKDATASFTDSDIKEGMTYTYVVKAFDDAGLISPSAPLAISVADAGAMPGVEKLTAKYDRGDKKVKVIWEYNQKGNYEFVVFRGMDGSDLSSYKKVTGDKKSMEEFPAAGKYNYAVKVIYENGAESPLSLPVIVEAL